VDDTYNYSDSLLMNNKMELLEWEMTVKTGDVNNDGTPDILIAVHDILRVYDGKTFAKISERSFQTDHGLAANKAFYLRVEVADIDKNGKNDIMVMTSSVVSQNSPKFHLFLNGNLTTNDNNIHLTKDISETSAKIRTADFAVGDITGDNIDEIVCHVASFDKTSGLAVYVTFFNFENKSKLFSNLSELFNCGVSLRRINPIVLARLKGPAAPNYIVTSLMVLGADAFGKLFLAYNSYITDNPILYQVFGGQMVSGNFDKDISGREMVAFILCSSLSSNLWTGLRYIYVDNTNKLIIANSPTTFNTFNSGNNSNTWNPVLAAVNTSHTGKILEFKKHEYMLTSPQVDAVLAAAPYYPEWYSGSNEPSTLWGTSSSVGTGSETEVTHSASLILGFEHEWNVPIFAIKLGGIDFTAKIKNGISMGFSKERTVTKSIAYQSGKEDAVVLTAIPYDAYFYTVKKSDNPEQEEKEVMISFPRKPITQMISLKTYNQFTEGQNAPAISGNILKHTIGEPLSYPKSTAGLSNLIGNDQFLYTLDNFTGAGNTGGVSKEIEISKSQSTSKALSMDVEAELVFTILGGLKLGAGYGFNNTDTYTTTIGESTTVGAYVPGIRVEAPSNIYRFKWDLVWYNYKSANQTFSVVNYLVQKQ
jgi:hypothetical protein